MTLSRRLKHMLTALLLSLTAAIIGVSCGQTDSRDSSTTAIPRRRAWPRLELPAQQMRRSVTLGTTLMLNRIAQVTETDGGEGNRFVTVDYGEPLNARLLLTVIPSTPADIPSIIDNRAERINLNLSGNQAEAYTIDDNGITGELVICQRIATPAQFYLTDSRSRVLSGTLFIPSLTAESADSLAPVTDYLITDVAALVDAFAVSN